jgi:UPF0176 protein
MNLPTLNTSGYKFVALDELDSLRAQLKEKVAALPLKGTILLSLEGVNMFLAGDEVALNDFRAWLIKDARFLDIPWKDSWSDTQPFNRMLVKIKKEIISMDAPMICQKTAKRAKAVSPTELKHWLDQNSDDVVLLDTRNDYEVRLGSFQQAIELAMDHFREFPEKVKALLPALRHKKVVTFCTGGIRCEKAALYMEQLGFEEVYQLDGGILKYFEECQDAHYLGDCFVFDKRVAVDKNLQQTDTVMCFSCLAPLTMAEQQSPLYRYEVQCPYCADH